MEGDEADVRPFLELASNRSESASNLGISDLDWFGNTALHHCFANNEVVMPSVCKVLESYPDYASIRNQFGRIPLHYALDRIRVNYQGVKKLIEVYPQGVSEQDNDGKTPYDVAMRWKHSRAIMKLLLDAEPALDKEMYFKIRYGFLADMYNMITFRETEPKHNKIYSSPDENSRSSRAGNLEILSIVPASISSPRTTLPEAESSTSLLRLESQLSSLTSRGDISESNSSSNIHTSTGRVSMSVKEGRRSSVPDILEEEILQLGF